ncbi:hypothetical protein F4813DRAFT_384301 [Daldinia decipiens]|uniref:uncharacterized protein n=1 Tax=Daldinia decipiens TaxID=326647 RepID=UPI0020C36FD6|nr:uncharacterized protein F4813DRAFT_384301 [Daldinia decipiens]KAI1662720.1 hypothetical protein F4813DRAFT_384301 [Daldinia decipiens]
MLRTQLRRIALPTPNRLSGAGLSKRTLVYIPGEGLPPVPILRPTLWAFAATATIFLGCAAYDVRRDVQNAKRKGLFRDGSVASYEDLEDAKHRGHVVHSLFRNPPPPPPPKWHLPGRIGEMLAGHTDAEKLILGFSALNISLLGASSLVPGAFIQYLAHTPCFSPNYTHLTSMFGHTGPLHAGINTLALLQMGPEVARTSVFEGNGSHFAAFYLSTGIFSSLGSHLGTVLPTRIYKFNRLVPGLGASGVLYGMLGAWATQYPDARLGIMFIPGSYTVENFMTALVLFEVYGLFIGFPYIHLAHAAHLSGLAVGAAYVYFDGKNRLWRPTRKLAFGGMKLVKMV